MIRKVSAFLVAAFCFAACPAVAQFAETSSYAGNGGGTGAAQTITLPNALALTDILGVNVKWIPSNGNAGAATLNVNGFGAQAIQRVTPAGMAALGGGEIVAGHAAIAMWNGTFFDLQNSAAPDPPGHVMDYAGATCPTGWAAANGGTQTQANQLPLYGVLSTIWGSNSGGNFTLPDLRGRATFGQDSGGSGRITAAGGNFDGTVIGNTGGQQNWILTLAQLPTGITAAGTAGNFQVDGSASNFQYLSSVAGSNDFGSGAKALRNGTQASAAVSTTSNNTSGAAHPVLSNAAIVNKCVRF